MLGHGPTGGNLIFSDLASPTNPVGDSTVSIGQSGSLETQLGASSGVPLVGTQVRKPTQIARFGSLMVGPPSTALLVLPVPAGTSQHSFAVPGIPDPIGYTLAFQLWDPETDLGVPLVTVVTP